jgi:cyanophycinase
MISKLRTIAAALVSVAMAACTGGGGTTAPEPVPVAALQGQWAYAAAGIEYETSSGLKGLTDEKGSYSFRAGDRVSFKLGKLLLGDAAAAARIGFQDLIANGTDANSAKLVNILQLLQTLDADNNPANGLAISTTTLSSLVALTTTLSVQALTDAQLQAQVIDLVFGVGGRALVSENQAFSTVLANEGKDLVAGLPVVTNYVIGGGIRSCSSFSGDSKSANCAADWATILANDKAFAGLGKADISFDSNYVRPTLTYTLNQANIDKISAMPITNPAIFRSAQKTSLLAALNARLADTSKPSVDISFDSLDGGKAEFANGATFWNNSAVADFDLLLQTMCGAVSPVNGTQCTISSANIAAINAASFATPTDKPKVILILQSLQSSLGASAVFYRRDASGATATPNFRAAFQAVKLAADGTAPVLGLVDGLNPQELSALRESMVNPSALAKRKIEARTVALLSNADSKDIWDSFVASARSMNGGATPTIGVLTSAAENPWGDHDINVWALKSAGAKVVYIPMEGGLRKALDENNNCAYASVYYGVYGNSNSLSTNYHMDQVYPDIAALRSSQCANNAVTLNSTLSNLNGIFFAGGDQARHLETFVSKDADGKYTQLSAQLTILKTRFDAGQLVVAGTSAGAAVQSGGLWKGVKVPMLGSGYSWDVLNAGYAAGTGPTANEATSGALYADGGLGFFKYGVLDQHFSQRTREGRLVRATKENGLDYGFGVDENTTLIVGKPDSSGKTTMTVLGAGGVFIADVRTAAASIVGTAQYSISGVITHYVSAGDKLEINAAGELTITLGGSKLVVPANAAAKVATTNRVQEYGSSNYLKLVQSMAATGAAKGYGSTTDSPGQSPLFSVTLTRSPKTVVRSQYERLSYTNIMASFALCAGNVCAVPIN